MRLGAPSKPCLNRPKRSKRLFRDKILCNQWYQWLNFPSLRQLSFEQAMSWTLSCGQTKGVACCPYWLFFSLDVLLPGPDSCWTRSPNFEVLLIITRMIWKLIPPGTLPIAWWVQVVYRSIIAALEDSIVGVLVSLLSSPRVLQILGGELKIAAVLAIYMKNGWKPFSLEAARCVCCMKLDILTVLGIWISGLSQHFAHLKILHSALCSLILRD